MYHPRSGLKNNSRKRSLGKPKTKMEKMPQIHLAVGITTAARKIAQDRQRCEKQIWAFRLTVYAWPVTESDIESVCMHTMGKCM